MTQHKVIAEDSLSAMDEISKVLGKDAVMTIPRKTALVLLSRFEELHQQPI